MTDDPRPSEALTACASGQVAKGITILAALYAETRNPSFVFNQGRCYQRNGQLESAREAFREYLRVGKDEPPADIQRAQGFVREIDQELARRMALQDARPQERRLRGAMRISSMALAGLSVAAFATGAFLSTKVEAKERAVEKQFENEAILVDGTKVSQQISDGGRLETFQYIAYGVGVVALAGAATTFGLSGWSFRGESSTAVVTPVVTKHALGGLVQLRF